MRVAVYGLWHLGCVTAACLAEAGHEVRGLDPDGEAIAGLRNAQPPVREPGLAELLAEGLRLGRLSFTTRPEEALQGAEVLWVAFDTPVGEDDEPEPSFVRERLEAIRPALGPGTLVVVSSQVPVGFTGALEREWPAAGLRFACIPENLQLGRALEAFRRPERVIVGVRDGRHEPALQSLLAPFSGRVEWMSVESAEMSKHALNAFLAMSVAFANEIARLCEATGADAKDVERALRSEGRVGPRAFVAPGAAFAGGTLARDLRSLVALGAGSPGATPLLEGVLASNERQKVWLQDAVRRLLGGTGRPVVALLGLTYKPGTSTLRRSGSVELAVWLHGQGTRVQAHDPAVTALPTELASCLTLFDSAVQALRGADLAVVATPWPDYRTLRAEDFLGVMRAPRIVDPSWLLAQALGDDSRIVYVAAGRPAAGS